MIEEIVGFYAPFGCLDSVEFQPVDLLSVVFGDVHPDIVADGVEACRQ